MENAYQNSVIAQLLEAIINQSTYEGEATSVIAQILLSILNGTPYEGEATSVIAQLFVKLKAKIEGESFEPYEGEPVSNIAKILISIIEEEEYNYPPESRIAELLLQLKEELEAYTEVTVSGAIANFTTNTAKPLVNLTVYFKATQEAGTPTPQSPKAISGVSAVNNIHCGANLWDEQWELGYISNTTGENSPTTTQYRTVGYIRIPQGVNLYLFNGNSDTLGLRYYDKNKNFIGSRANLSSKALVYGTNDLPTETAYIRFVNTSTNAYLNNISFNYPSSDTEYHAYNPNSYTILINLGGTYYGGYVSQDKDGKREGVVTHELRHLKDLNIRYSNNSGAWASWLFFVEFSDKKRGQPIKCTHYETVTINNVGNLDNLKITAPTWSSYVCWRDDTYTSADDFIQNAPDITIMVELAEPFTVALPDGEPILAFNGVNNIYNDSDNTSVTYLYKGEPPVSLSFGKGSTDDENESEYKDTDEPKEVDEPKEKEDNIIKEELKDLDDNQERRS